MGITHYVKGLSLERGGDVDAEVGLVATASQPIAEAGTTQVMPWNLSIHEAFRFEHDVAVNNSEITLPTGLQSLHFGLELQVDNGASNNTLTLWAQVNISGAGWVNVAESGTHINMPANSSIVLSHTRTAPMPKPLVENDALFRFVIQGDSTNLQLEAHAAAGDFPRIPSASLFMSAN